MSEEGWRAFLAAGLEDWAVVHGGAVAAFEVTSLAEAAALAHAIAHGTAEVAEPALITISANTVTVRLTRDLWSIESHHIALARTVTRIAWDAEARARREGVQEVQVAIAARPDQIDVGFWRAVLGYDAAAPDNAVDPWGHSSTVWMQDLDPERALRHAMHIDVSVPREQARARVDAAVAAGGRIIAENEAPASWILSDAAGNRVCIAAWPDGAEPSEENAAAPAS